MMGTEGIDRRSESVDHARRIAREAEGLLSAIEISTDMHVAYRRGEHVAVVASPAPDGGISITVRPHVAPMWTVEGVSVVLSPATRGPGLPTRFGLLDDRGQLLFRSLAPGAHRMELREPWWLDDARCEGVSSGKESAWAVVHHPVIVRDLPRAEMQLAAREGAQVAASSTLGPRRTTTFLSADGSLRYEVVDGDMSSVRAFAEPGALDRPGERAAVCIGIKEGRAVVFSSPFALTDEEGWWATDEMSPPVLVALGARPQPRPNGHTVGLADDVAPLGRSPVGAGLRSSWARERRLEAMDLAHEDGS